jgi:putative hemolysin
LEEALFEPTIVLLLIVLNGVFSLSELAVVSARRSRLRAMAESGRPGAQAALSLTTDPGRFLSTVQIGITLVGVVAGAFSGSTFGARLADWLVGVGLPVTVAEPLGFGVVVAIVTYLSIVVGELVPKRLALSNAEELACAVAPPMALVSRIASPLVWLLDSSSKLIFRLLGRGNEPEEKVTEDDVRALVAEAERHGTIETAERHMIAGVLRLGERPVRGVMTPRIDVEWINAAAGQDAMREVLMHTTHSRLPIGEGSTNDLIGVVQSRELLAALLRGEALNPRSLARPAPVVPASGEALDVLSTLREAEVPMAFVHDEYGNFEGLVTPTDLTSAIVGAFRSDAEAGQQEAAVRRDDGSWLFAGAMHADEMADLLRLKLPTERSYQTVAGFVLQAMKRLPQVGEAVEVDGWRFEVVDLDGLRIDKVLAQPTRSTAILATRRPGAGADPRPPVALLPPV